MVTTWFKRSSRFKILAAIMTVALMLTLAVKVSAQVPTPSSSTSLSSKLVNAFSPPRGPGSPMPDNREPGATRDPRKGEGCTEAERGPIALVPNPDEPAPTASEYPTVFWYMPQTVAPAAEFLLRDETDKNYKDVYRVQYALPKSTKGVVSPPGIKSLTIANLYPLEIGQAYHWYLALICNPSNRSNDIVVQGFIKRVESDPTLASRLQQATPEERIGLYADARLWYETLGALVELRRDRPNDPNLDDAWNTLLSSVGLEYVIAGKQG